MKKVYLIAIMSVCAFSILYYFARPAKLPVQQALDQYRDDVNELYLEVNRLIRFVEQDKPVESLRKQFFNCRAAYKKTEWLAEYYNSYTCKYINGPAIREVEADEKSVVIQPEGFQVVEELLFPQYDAGNKDALLTHVSVLQSNIKRLQVQTSSLETTDAHVFDAMRLQLFRIISLGIAGFDSPFAKNSIREAYASIRSLNVHYSFYGGLMKERNPALHDSIQRLFDSTENFLDTSSNFVSFDRAAFITQYANPLGEHLVAGQEQLSIPFFTEPRPLLASAPTLFSNHIFNAEFYAPLPGNLPDAGKIALGKQLFHEPGLSGNGKISCASCHQPGKAFTDGLKTSLAVNGKDHVKRNAPGLINAALQSSLFYDLRVAYLEDQANEVILNKDEMHGSFERAVSYLSKRQQYKHHFREVFHDAHISPNQIKQAIASYLRSLVSFNTRFDLYMRGNVNAMNREEIRGFNIFMGKGKCGTCHFTPLFNGTVPPTFTNSEAEVIGVPGTNDTLNVSLDEDEGKFSLYKIPLHKHAFKTPGLRNVALTAPYMHNGVFKTLEEVVEFYNRGGGGGSGLEIENLTLPPEKLHLSGDEKQALVAFLGALTDTTLTGK